MKTIFSGALFFLCTLLAADASAQEFALTITVSDGFSSRDLTCGLQSSATNGIDAGLDVPAPPFPILLFDAQILPEDPSMGTNFYTDFRAYTANGTDFEIQIQPDPSVDDLTLSWNQVSLPKDRSFTFVDRFGGQFFSLDLKTMNSLKISPTENAVLRNGLTLQVGPGEQLPVELSAFEVEQAGSTMVLQWQTSTETNNAGFSVERGLDGTQFESIGFVEGFGTTLEAQSYRFTDPLIPADVPEVYYRLKQTDFDGSFTYSQVERVRVATPREIQLEPAYPNPSENTFQIRYGLHQAQPVRVTIYDALGRPIQTLVDTEQAAGLHQVSFDGSRLPPGLYWYELVTPHYSATQTLILAR